MRTREEQIKPWGYISPFAKKSLQDSARCDLTITRKSTISTTMPLYTAEHILEAERRAEQRVRAEISVGYIFHNPDTGTEILPYHPVKSGECLDAQDIRQATAEVLREELVSAWEEMANGRRKREERGEESRKDSERLDWLCRNIKGDEARRIVGVISDTSCVDLWCAAIDAAREVG